ncbi:MAG TPA: D-alanyl-D-alanine carboxypeptidase/D-alanyl-D-alanine-endopeptidase [Solirubrobacterales bacterium]|nr:D-alanyl-D-alanine carboxypeptidase/D-alanyl-D-alanine-endopeptidase [Solirubrobacterales bacterium]
MKRATILLAVVLAAALLLATAAGGARASGLCDQMRSLLTRGGGPSSGLLVVDSGTGKAVCQKSARSARPLASNMKLFTTSAALSLLGPETRIPTRVLSSGTLGSDGALHGDLYLVGGGDPALGTPSFYNRFHNGLGTDIFSLVPQIRAAGITSISGRLYADDTIFDRLRGVADSGYATSSYIGPLSGLSFNSGYSTPRASGFSSEPAKLAASTLAAALRKAGISVREQVARRQAPAKAKTIAVVRSPQLTRLIDLTDVYSDNFFAETLLKLLGARLGDAGTTAAGAGVVSQFARELGSGVHAVDGSGLTRSGRASPLQVVELLQSMRNTAVGSDFVEDLAVAGEEGTVASRMQGTAAAGRCHTKTGTLTGVSNLSGYCFNRSGKVMIFSILMGSVGDLSLAHLEQDRIAAAVASY